jgi:hypothetical protein
MQEFKSFVFEISFDFFYLLFFDHAWSKLHVIDPQIRLAYCVY